MELQANRHIPGLPPTPVQPHNGFKVRLGVTPPAREEAAIAGARPCKYVSHQRGAGGAPTWTLNRLADEYFRLTYIDETEFTIDLAGRSIWATWSNSLTLEDTVTYLVGPVLGFVLRSLGTVCLHASVVAVDGYAILLTGPPGAGKSTTAAAFAALGFPVQSDDIAALSIHDGQVYMQPGYPRVNLWADSDRRCHDCRSRRGDQRRANQDRRAMPLRPRCQVQSILLRIEEELGESAVYAGKSAFVQLK